MSRFDILGQPYKIGEVTIKNRYAFSPVTTGGTQWDEEGNITPKYVRYMEERAKGGFGLIVTGAMSTDHLVDPLMPTGPSPLLTPEAFVKSSKNLLDAVHAHGTKIFAQLSLGLGRSYATLYSPSENVVFGTEDELSPELTVEQIKLKIRQLVDAAKLAKEAGWDGIEVHAMHWGYLLDQFCMKCFNRRTDEYGGSWENRLRAAREIIDGIKDECGKDFPVGMRLSLETYVKGANQGLLTEEGEQGRTLEESLMCAEMLEYYGYDYLSVDVGVYDSFWYACPPMYVPQGFMFDMAAKCRERVDIPVICGGRMNDAAACADAISAGKFDAVTIGRPGVADAQYPNKAIAGETEKIRPCLGCNYGCFKRVCMDFVPITCAVNPVAGHEIDLELKPSDISRKVIVVGGGAGGMEAARTAALRGFDVTLMEKTDRLGGHIIEAGAHDFKKEVRQLNEWYQRELKELDVNILYNHEATADELKSLSADLIVLATGSRTSVPPIKGIENTVSALDAIDNPEKLGDSIIVAGGGLVGCEIALDEINRGKDVTVIEALDDIMLAGETAPFPNGMMIKAVLPEKGVNILTKTRVIEIGENGVTVEDSEGNRREISGDTVVNALGFKSDNALAAELEGCSAKVVTVGDANRPANILNAVADAYAAVNNL